MTTVSISAADVNKLRKQTGAGMMDCKKALVEANGDFEQAIDYLRKKGQKVAMNRSDRDANEGLIIAKVTADNKRANMICLNCETDFVAKNQDFIDYANQLADLAVANDAKNVDEFLSLELEGKSVKDGLLDQVGKIGEKIEVSAVERVEAAVVIAYNHPGNKLASILGLSSDTPANIEEIGKDIAMQIAAMAPVAIDKDDVDATIIERELEVGREQAREQGKPEEMIEKIATGKLNKFYKESTLLNQAFIKDEKKTIRKLLEDTEKDLTITAFKRLQLGN
ncbi:MAG: elongation factor Ts [Bacteroidia bacterium]|nr:elongation factor Ts [Bacteroidia bacterium]